MVDLEKLPIRPDENGLTDALVAISWEAEARKRERDEIETRFWSIVDGDGMASVPSDMWDALERIARAARNRDMWKGQCERQSAELERMREAARVLGQEAVLLLNNAEGCAVNHYGEDFARLGMPGWLADSRKRVMAARAALGGTYADT